MGVAAARSAAGAAVTHEITRRRGTRHGGGVAASAGDRHGTPGKRTLTEGLVRQPSRFPAGKQGSIGVANPEWCEDEPWTNDEQLEVLPGMLYLSAPVGEESARQGILIQDRKSGG